MTTAYHHGNLRAALVAEGLDLARLHGAEGVVLREVARRVGVSHNAAYRHFADRSQLLREIGEQGMELLVEAMEERLRGVPATLDAVRRERWRLRAIGRSYVEFALAEPGLFGVAFAGLAPPGDPVDGPPEDPYPGAPSRVSGPFAVLGRTLDALVEVGYLDPERRAGADIACWSAVHGFAVLHLQGPLVVTPAAARDDALERLLTVLDLGLGVPPGPGDG